MLIHVTAGFTASSDVTTITHVYLVKASTTAVSPDWWISMLSSCVLLLLQHSLNCLMMLLIFSKRCTSACGRSAACAMTRKVARSKSTTSSASETSQKRRRRDSRVPRLGMREHTTEDHALYSDSFQIDVGKHSTGRLLDTAVIAVLRSLKTASRFSSGTRSILWIKQNTLAPGLLCARLSTHSRKYSISLAFSRLSTSNTYSSTSTLVNTFSRWASRKLSIKSSCPPQSHRLSARSPTKRMWLCSTSSVGPSRSVSLGT
mmetsp:Transcript_2430/g.6488  ORF Transcript_2430/g.6488 Transcript_2430/m.6488 type:complete len:260 (-) Transcript_2430:142-921(-)